MALPTTGTPGTTVTEDGLPFHWLNGRWQHGPDPADPLPPPPAKPATRVNTSADRLALAYPRDVDKGTIVIQGTDGRIYRFEPPTKVGDPITELNWKLLDFLSVDTDADRTGLDTRNLHPGTVVSVKDAETVWRWSGNTAIYSGGWEQIVVQPTAADRSMLRKLEYDPELSDGLRLDWKDARDDTISVQDRAALFGIPVSHLNTGKLVYVAAESTLFEFAVDPTAKAGDISDWKALGLTIPEFNRKADLPQPSAAKDVEEGELAMVRLHADALTPLDQLFVARFLDPANPKTATWVPVNVQIFEKPTRATPDVADASDEDLQVTAEVGHFELKRYDKNAGAWKKLYSEDDVKNWISAGNLFLGTVEDPGHGTAGSIDIGNISSEAALGSTDKGKYFTWVGMAGYTLQAKDVGGAASSIDGATMNVGDWIQCAEIATGNFSYVVIPGDLLAKSRGDSIYGLSQWGAGAYEKGSLVVYQGKIWKASAAVLTTEGAPGGTGSSWAAIALSGGLRAVQTDGDLPAMTGASTDLYLVVNSAKAGNRPAIYLWDQPSLQWRTVGGAGGGGGTAMALNTGKTVINVGVPIGTVIHWPSTTLPTGYHECDGSAFDQALYPELFTVLGKAVVPDLRGQFLRGANGDFDNLTKHQWTTGMPRSRFQTQANGGHHHTVPMNNDQTDWNGGNVFDHELTKWGKTTNTSTNGSHGHTITGGDPESAPDHVRVMIAIKMSPDSLKLRP